MIGPDKYDLDKLCAQARARLKHWVGMKAARAKAQVGRNGYQAAYAALLEEQAAKDRLHGFRDKRGPQFERGESDQRANYH